MPEIAEVVDSPFAHGELSLKARHRVARQLARRGYQRAYVLPNSIKSALVPFFAGIPERIGFVGEKPLRPDQPAAIRSNKALLPQMAERFAQLAEAPGAPLVSDRSPSHD
jgi:heptosyltransferase-2